MKRWARGRPDGRLHFLSDEGRKDARMLEQELGSWRGRDHCSLPHALIVRLAPLFLGVDRHGAPCACWC